MLPRSSPRPPRVIRSAGREPGVAAASPRGNLATISQASIEPREFSRRFPLRNLQLHGTERLE